MTMRKIWLFAGAALLAGCASTQQTSTQNASVQSAVYVVSDATSAIPISDGAVAENEGKLTSTVPGAPKAMKLYWFLGGR